VSRYLVRVRLPDRPGALGLVASRIGSVGGDIVVVDITERGGGMAVDEFVVELASAELVGLLRHEILEVDGVSIEELRELEEEVE
jgi:ACT domain-containing protein